MEDVKRVEIQLILLILFGLKRELFSQELAHDVFCVDVIGSHFQNARQIY